MPLLLVSPCLPCDGVWRNGLRLPHGVLFSWQATSSTLLAAKAHWLSVVGEMVERHAIAERLALHELLLLLRYLPLNAQALRPLRPPLPSCALLRARPSLWLCFSYSLAQLG